MLTVAAYVYYHWLRTNTFNIQTIFPAPVNLNSILPNSTSTKEPATTVQEDANVLNMVVMIVMMILIENLLEQAALAPNHTLKLITNVYV
jgi:hypothetical protein